MKYHFYQNIGLLILINLLIKPLYIFCIEAEVQNQIGDQAYGLYFAIFNFLFIFQWILDPGIQNFNSQLLSKERTLLQETIKHTITAKVITAAVFFIGIGFIGCLIFGWHLLPIILLMLGNMILLSFAVFLRSHFSIVGSYVTDSILSSVDKLLLVLALGYVLYVSPTEITVLRFVQIQTIVLIASVLVIGICFLRRFSGVELKFELPQIKSIIQKSFPFALIFILMSLYNRMDGIMLKFLVDDNSLSAGIYAAGFRVYDAMNMIGYLFAGLLLPMYANAITHSERLHNLYDESLRLMLVIAILASFGTFFYSGEILSMIYDNVDDRHIGVFRVLSLSFFSVALTYIYSTLMTASAKLKIFNRLLGLGVVVNFGLNLYLIPRLQAEGAAIATFITQGLLLIGQIVLVFSTFAFKVDYRLFFQVLSIIAVTIAAYLIIQSYLPIHFIFQLCLGAIISLAYILALNFLRLDTIKARNLKEN